MPAASQQPMIKRVHLFYYLPAETSRNCCRRIDDRVKTSNVQEKGVEAIWLSSLALSLSQVHVQCFGGAGLRNATFTVAANHFEDPLMVIVIFSAALARRVRWDWRSLVADTSAAEAFRRMTSLKIARAICTRRWNAGSTCETRVVPTIRARLAAPIRTRVQGRRASARWLAPHSTVGGRPLGTRSGNSASSP